LQSFQRLLVAFDNVSFGLLSAVYVQDLGALFTERGKTLAGLRIEDID